MALIKVVIYQGFRAGRKIVAQIEAEDIEDAIEQVNSGSVEIPDFNDQGWKTTWDLQTEEVTAA